MNDQTHFRHKSREQFERELEGKEGSIYHAFEIGARILYGIPCVAIDLGIESGKEVADGARRYLPHAAIIIGLSVTAYATGIFEEDPNAESKIVSELSLPHRTRMDAAKMDPIIQAVVANPNKEEWMARSLLAGAQTEYAKGLRNKGRVGIVPLDPETVGLRSQTLSLNDTLCLDVAVCRLSEIYNQGEIVNEWGNAFGIPKRSKEEALALFWAERETQVSWPQTAFHNRYTSQSHLSFTKNLARHEFISDYIARNYPDGVPEHHFDDIVLRHRQDLINDPDYLDMVRRVRDVDGNRTRHFLEYVRPDFAHTVYASLAEIDLPTDEGR